MKKNDTVRYAIFRALSENLNPFSLMQSSLNEKSLIVDINTNIMMAIIHHVSFLKGRTNSQSSPPRYVLGSDIEAKTILSDTTGTKSNILFRSKFQTQVLRKYEDVKIH